MYEERENSDDRISVNDLESTLCQIREVKAVRVVPNSKESIAEVHVLAEPERSAKQLARDVESTLQAQYGLKVDHKKISVVQLGTKEVTRDKARLKIVAINTEVSAIYAAVTVILKLDGGEYKGIAKGPASQTGRLRLVAQSTLEAVEKFTKGICGFALEDVSVLTLGREKVAVSCVTLVTPLGEETFSGAAIVKQDKNDSIVRATLDAINRRFGNLIASE